MHCYFLSLDFQNALDTVDSFYMDSPLNNVPFMLLSQLISSSTILLVLLLFLFIYLVYSLYCIVLYYSDLEHSCGFYAIPN